MGVRVPPPAPVSTLKVSWFIASCMATGNAAQAGKFQQPDVKHLTFYTANFLNILTWQQLQKKILACFMKS
jgi:hypothetical protein